MKIKIPPYPNFKITESVFEKSKTDAVKTSNSEPLSNQLIMIVPFKTGEKRLIRSRPVEYKGNRYVTSFPNPVHIFLSTAIEYFEISETIKETNFPKCGKKFGDDIYLLDIEENGTHTCYNNYIKYKTSSIIMLVSSIEAFLNHIIPNDFIYNTVRKKKEVQFTKVDIESPKINFREKLIKVIPQYLQSINSEQDLESENETIFELYENRKNLIHLKTNAEDDLTVYFNEIDKMLDFDLNNAIELVISFMNKVKPEFVEIE